MGTSSRISVKKVLCVLFVVIFVVTAGSCGIISAEAKVQTFDGFLQELFKEYVSENAITLHHTLVHPEEYGIDPKDVGFGGLDLSQEAMDAEVQQIKANLKKLKSFDYEKLNTEEQFIYKLLENDFTLSLESEKYTYMYEPFAYTSGLQMNIPIAMGEYTFYDEDDVEGYLSLMEDVSEYIDTCLEFEKTKSEKGLFMAEGCAEEVIRQCNEFIEKPAQNMLISTFNDRIEEVEGITQRELEQYKKKNYDAVTKLIIPAYERIITTFEELKDTGENQLGLAYYDGGKEYYKYLLKSNVGTDKTPEQVIKLLDKKIRKTMKSFQDLAYKNYDAYVQYYNGADLYGELDPEETIRYFAKFFAKRFPKTPEYEFSVEQIHDSMKGSTSPAFYIVPPVDDYTHNFIFTNPSSENGSGIWSTLAHEGVPGHMYQNVYFYSRMSNPIRAILDYSGYSEGWATYVEMMSFSAYDYDNPVYGKFEKYNNQLNLLLSARLEIGVNYEGWDLGDTRAYLNEEGFNEEVAESVMDYVIAEPVNYQTYCLGWLEFEELRSYAKKHLKDNFSEKEFHQVVLDAGPSPFYILEESVKEYVKGSVNTLETKSQTSKTSKSDVKKAA